MAEFRSAIVKQLVNPSLTLSDQVKRQKLQKASDPTTDPEILDELADFPDEHIRHAVLGNSAIALPTLMKLMGYGLDVHSHPLIISMVTLPPERNHPFFHRSLYQDIDPTLATQKMQRILAFVQHPSASIHTLRILAKHPDSRVIAAVLKNNNVNPELMFSLSEHPDPYIRTLVSKHSKSSPLLLSKMVDNALNQKMRPEKITLAGNVNCPPDSLDKLSSDNAAWVRRCVARNRNTPIHTLSKLAFDNNSFVRTAVLKHGQTPLYILTRMAHDKDPSIRAALARNPRTPNKVLEKLSHDAVAYVRAGVASNVNTKSFILDRLASDTDPQVRTRVRKNPNVSELALERIKSHEYISYSEPGTSSLFSHRGELPIVRY